MESLQRFSALDIDWDLAPEDAVTMYLEWGNNNWHSARAPVRSKDDESIYFVVDTWEKVPIIRLIRRNTENSSELVALPMPDHLLPAWKKEHGNAHGVFAPGEEIIRWLQEQLETPDGLS